jgi:uncharacterized protein (TIGR03083 family)
MSDLWDIVSTERGALAEDLSTLTDSQWNSPSLCSGWTVRDVLAHMSATASLNPATFFLNFAKAGFNFGSFAETQIRRHLGGDPAATLDEFRSLQGSTSAPPGPKPTWLGEVVVHSADIRRPLGIPHTYAPGAVRQAADFYKNSNTLIGTKNRIGGLALCATDEDWSHGEGHAVEGPLLPLLLAMTGRGHACADLSGPGVDTLRSRCG